MRYSSKPLTLRWECLPDGSLQSSQFKIMQARRGFQWELWRRTSGVMEALGTGSKTELQILAESFVRGEKRVEEDYTEFVAALVKQAGMKRPTLSQRARAWLNS